MCAEATRPDTIAQCMAWGHDDNRHNWNEQTGCTTHPVVYVGPLKLMSAHPQTQHSNEHGRATAYRAGMQDQHTPARYNTHGAEGQRNKPPSTYACWSHAGACLHHNPQLKQASTSRLQPTQKPQTPVVCRQDVLTRQP